MKLKTNTLIIIASVLAIITTANAQDFTDRFGDRISKGVNLAMMGGGGMMGDDGMMGGRRIFNGFGGPQSEPGDDYQQNQNINNQRIHREEIQRLHERVQQKRRELSSLYRSDTADEEEINRKIDELSNLERYLDEKISSYDVRR